MTARVHYIPCKAGVDPLPALEKNYGKLGKYDSIGLVSTSQHMHTLEGVKSFLESKNKTVQVGGHVLGCQQNNAIELQDKVDAFLYIGSGKFHPLGVLMKTSKPVYVLNPYSSTLDELSPEEKKRFIGRQKARIMKALEANVFGILVSTRTHQFKLEQALEVKKRIEAQGKKALLFAGDDLNPDNLLPFKVDCWINTGCPRIIDDMHDKPLLNPDELDLVGDNSGNYAMVCDY